MVNFDLSNEQNPALGLAKRRKRRNWCAEELRDDGLTRGMHRLNWSLNQQKKFSCPFGLHPLASGPPKKWHRGLWLQKGRAGFEPKYVILYINKDALCFEQGFPSRELITRDDALSLQAKNGHRRISFKGRPVRFEHNDEIDGCDIINEREQNSNWTAWLFYYCPMSLVGDLSAVQLVTFDDLVHFGSLNFLHHFFRGFKNNNI